MAIELGVGYVSVVPSTGSFKQELQKQLDGMGFESSFSKHGKKAGQGFGKSFGSELSSSLPGVGALQQTLSGYQGASAKAGALAGKALGTAFKAAATAGIAAAGYTLFKGFERYQALDAASKRLENLNTSFQKLGKTGVDVSQTMEIVKKSVEGTPYSLSDAFTQATNAIASGVTDIKKYMDNIADAAAFAGDDISRIGSAFTQVINQGKLDAGILQNQLANLPIKAWLNEVYGAQVDVTKAISDGRVGIEQLQYVVEKFADNMAKTAGDTIAGSIENMNTGFARLGANILAALFGGPTEEGTNGLKSAIDAITGKLKDMDAWVVAHKDDIKAAFDSATEAAQTLIDVIKDIKGFLDDIGVGADDVVYAFVAWKTIAGVSSLATALGGLNTMIGVTLPASAASAASKISSAFLPLAGIIAGGAIGAATLNDAINELGANTEAGKNARNQATAPGMGVPGASRDPIFQPSAPSSEPWTIGGGGPFGPPDTGTVVGSDGKSYAPVPTGTPGAVVIPGKNQWGIPASGSASSGGREPGWGGDSTLGAPPPLLPGKPEKEGKAPKPVVPFNQTLPGWTAGTPQTESFFGAASSWLDTRHDLEEQQAFLNQLQQDNTATESEILDAKNDLAKKTMDMHKQDLNLQNARIKAYEDFYKTGEKTKDALADSLGGIVELDEDLGISRGLVGIADNLLRFLAGLAAAPIKGLLAGAQKEMEAKLPDGWLGKPNPLMASSGASSGIVPLVGEGGNLSLPGMFSDSGAPSGMFGTQAATGGVPPTEDLVKNIAKQFGLQVTSEDRPGDPGYHGQGMALDVSNGTGNTAEMAAFADYMSKNFGSDLKELIYHDGSFDGNIKNGQAAPGTSVYDSGTLEQHRNHVHIAADWAQGIKALSQQMPQQQRNFAPAGLGGNSTRNWLSSRLLQSGLSPDEARGILAMNMVEGGEGNAKSLLGFVEGQKMNGVTANGPEGHLAAFLTQWNDMSRRPEGGGIPGITNGKATNWGAYMTWIRQKIVGQNGFTSDWQGNAQPPPEEYQGRLMQGLQGIAPAQPDWGMPWQRAAGGTIPGSGRGDKIPVLAEPGEHMLSRDDVARMGGQSGVYSFRNALHRQTGGPIPHLPLDQQDPSLPGPVEPMPAPTLPGVGTPAFDSPTQIKPAEAMPAAPDLAPKLDTQQPAMLGSDGQPIIGPDGRPIGMDGNPMDMPSDQQAAEFDKRLAGFIPQAAKANTVSGTSNLSKIWMMGAEVANGIIDQAASAASTAASLAVAGGTMGAGAAGGSQAAAAGASFLIGLGTEAAKRGISYGAQMGGIFSDAIVEQLFPFGAPGFIGFDSANNSINGLIDTKKKAGVYDSGGVLEPGGVAVNMSSRPESVLTQQQWDAMAQTGPASNGYGIKIENVHVADVDEMSRSLSARQRLAAMQYTGRPGM